MKFAFRSLLKTPGFTAIALLTLALGIGANTSMFTVLNTLLLQDVPFAAPGELVRIFRTSPQSRTWPHAAANFLDYEAQAKSFTALAATNRSNYSYSPGDQPAERFRGMDVTAGFFPMLGIQPVLGRFFTAEENTPGGPAAIILTHECWTRRFVADPAVIGRQIRLNSRLVTIVGVMPASFVPPLMWGQLDAFQPLTFNAAQQQNRSNNYLTILGRLAPGVTPAQAQAELDGLSARLTQLYPQTNSSYGLRLVPLANSDQGDASRNLTWLVMGLAGFVLLIACANLANLQFTRTAARSREHAIRVALGASRWQIMRELLTESLLLGLTGGALGVLVAVWCNDLLGRHVRLAGGITSLDLPLDLRVVGFALVVSILSGLAFGLLPAWLASRTDVNDALKLGSRGIIAGSARLRHALIVIEVALALILLTGAGVFLRGLEQFTQRDPGWRTAALLTGFVNLPANKYPDDDARRLFFTKLADNLAASPLLTHSALSSSLPTGGYSSSANFTVQGQPVPAPGREPLANVIFTTPGYVDTLGLRLVQGRYFNADDRADRPLVVVINEAMARALFPGENPIGRRLGGTEPEDPAREIIGVVSHAGAPASLTPPDTRFQMYYPIMQETFGGATIVVRGRVPAEQLTNEMRKAVAAIDPDLPVHSVISIRGDIKRSLANYHLIGGLLGGFALLGLMLASVGIYGVLASFVVQRTQEIGIRMALGAQVGTVLRLIFGRGLGLSLLGLVIGLVGAFGLVHLLGTILPEMGRPDPLTLVAIVVTLLLVSFFACYLPARRAAKVDPLVALRAE